MTPSSIDPTGAGDGKGYLTDERKLIRDSARKFTMKEVLPVANRLDPQQGMIPMELRQKMADMGYFGIRIPAVRDLVNASGKPSRESQSSSDMN